MRPELLNSLFVPVSHLKGIGPKYAKLIAQLLGQPDQAAEPHIADLLFHLPHSVIDRRKQPRIADAVPGEIVTMKVHVDRHRVPPRGNKRIPYRIQVHDDSGELDLVFFHANHDWLGRTMPEGETRFISGRIESFNGKLNMVHPDHMVSEEEFSALPLVEPVYGTTAGLSQKVLAKAINAALNELPQLPEWIDPAHVAKQHWPTFYVALHRVHLPRDQADLDPLSPARQRLAFDELLARQLALALLRARLGKSKGKARTPTGELSRKLSTRLPFELTGAQQRAIGEIAGDLQKPERMLRLLQGDVGSGKTIVAFSAMLQAIESGAQAALMAPTEILVRQHFATLEPFCEHLGVIIALLTGKETGAKRKEILAQLEEGKIDILIGTHALFQSGVSFRDLGLAVIDEQHRFGVHQRLALGEKGDASDVLVMTATPIPRTLVLTAYGDMEISILDEKPAGRRPITTTAMPLERIDELKSRVVEVVSQGRKLYWICPLVEESEHIDVTSAEDRFKDLQGLVGTQAGLVHGRMSQDEKNAAMQAFKDGETRLLVATTVIEVGVDVPDATIMVIEHAERFGLAQLHQLRGRVGRGDQQSNCILLYSGPLSEAAQRRLAIMRETEDGFKIAEEDLRLRGEGELLGTKQSGTPGFNLVQLEFHAPVLEMARDQAKLVMHGDPQLKNDQGTALRHLLYLFGQDQAIRFLRAG